MSSPSSLSSLADRISHPPTPCSPGQSAALPHLAVTGPQLPLTPLTPPLADEKELDIDALNTAVQVLSTEATALSFVSRLYQVDPLARLGFSQAVASVVRSVDSGGKVVVVGVGKSGKIGQKLVATLNSLGILSVFLHPVEALHGDIGVLRPTDTILLISFSGNTPELHNLLKHFPQSTPLIAMTSHVSQHSSPLTRDRGNTFMLPTPIHEKEEVSFGVSAPTTSTTVALAVGDALCVAVARQIHGAAGNRVDEVFKSYHPGGAIGQQSQESSMKILGVPIVTIPLVTRADATDASGKLRLIDAIVTALRNPGGRGWVRFNEPTEGKTWYIPSRRLQSVSQDFERPLEKCDALLCRPEKFFLLPEHCGLDDVKKWAASIQTIDNSKCGGRCFMNGVSVLGLVDGNRELCKVLELQDILDLR